jgi:hypothetical protein
VDNETRETIRRVFARTVVPTLDLDTATNDSGEYVSPKTGNLFIAFFYGWFQGEGLTQPIRDGQIQMPYETTEVPVSRSQEGIRKMIYAHKGTGVNLISHPPREGFEAMVTIEKISYHIRIMATCRTHAGPGYAPMSQEKREQEERRVWRVLYWHLKAVFEASDSGVIDIRDVIMPYVVTRDGRTLSEIVVPRMEQLMQADTVKLLE